MNPTLFKRKLDVSVILACYNQEPSLDLAFESLLNQNFSGKYEVIVCDDGSRAQLFNEFRDRFNDAGISIRYVWQQDRRITPGKSRNNGIKLSEGRLLLFLDGDMVPTLDLLEQHSSAHKEERRLVMAGNRCWRSFDDLNRTDIHRMPIQEKLKLLEASEPSDPKLKEREDNERRRRQEWLYSEHNWKVCFGCHFSVAWSLEVLFDDAIVGWSFDDWEIAYRLCVQHGYRPSYRDDFLAFHLETIEGMGNVFRRNKHEEIVSYLKSAFYFFDKCAGLRTDEVFFGLPRFELNPVTNTWRVTPRPSSYELDKKVAFARSWLKNNGIYP